MMDTTTAEEVNDLANRVRSINEANGWVSPEQDTPTHKIAVLALITTEVAEAIEDVRNGHERARLTIQGREVTWDTMRGCWVSTDGMGTRWASTVVPKPEGLPSEVADVIIRALDFAAARGIDIGAAIEQKLAYNETRAHRHGEKAL